MVVAAVVAVAAAADANVAAAESICPRRLKRWST